MQRFYPRLPIMLGVLITLALCLSAPGVPVRAQDGDSPDPALTEEQLGWLQRVHDALANLDSVTNYAVTHTGSTFTAITLELGGDALTGSQVESWLRTQTTFPGDPLNITAAITSTSSTVDFGAAEAISFGLLADARLVGGVLYVNTTPIQTGPDLPPVPAGWIVVDDPDNEAYDVLSSLQLDDLLDEDSIFDDLAALVGVVEDVTWQSVTLADGAPADQITVTFSLDLIYLDAYGLSEADQAQWRAVFDSAARIESTIQATMIVNADTLPVTYKSQLLWRVEGADAAGLFPAGVPAGTLMDMVAESAQESAITAVNEAIEPVPAPE